MPQKILVFRTGSMGDSICAMPAMVNIRENFKECSIDLLTNSGKGYASLVSIERLISPGIFDSIINYENMSRSELISILKHNKYDLVIQLPQYGAYLHTLVRDMIFFRFVIKIRSGFGWQYSKHIFFKKTQGEYGVNINERDRLNNILSENGLIKGEPNKYPFQLTDSDYKATQSIWESLSIDGSKPLIGVIVGAKRPQNRWPLSNFEQIIKHYSNSYNFLFIGSEEDANLVNELLNYSNTYSCCGLLTPLQSGIMLQRCIMTISNDTGPMHLSYAFGQPLIALFSNRDYPKRWYPPESEYNIVFRATGIECSICLSETCKNNICMKKITPQEVIFEMDKLLNKLKQNKR